MLPPTGGPARMTQGPPPHKSRSRDAQREVPVIFRIQGSGLVFRYPRRCYTLGKVDWARGGQMTGADRARLSIRLLLVLETQCRGSSSRISCEVF